MSSTVLNQSIRNIAIIAHVDHGKTTIVDAMFRQSGLFRENQRVSERLMDTMDLEKERGITIAAKNCAIQWKGVKINIVDTPGHADFGAEVERALSMVDGAVLLVDASEGPLPQTRFVLEKALKAELSMMVIINKIDRSDARPQEVLDEIYDLFIDLNADENQLEFPIFYAAGRDGIATPSLDEKRKNLHDLLDGIVTHIPAPEYNPNLPFQMLVTDLSYSDYLGRLAIGRIAHGRARIKDSMVCIGKEQTVPLKITRLDVYQGPSLVETLEAEPGDIVLLAGVENVHIGDTIATQEAPLALARISVDEPTVSMTFSSNTGPFSGREGSLVQSSKIRERLMKETLLNVAIRVEDSDERDSFVVKGRGEFQMVILLEQMRREGFELCVTRPKVILKTVDGVLMEPIVELVIDCREEYLGVVTEKLSRRRGIMESLTNHGSGRVRIMFSVPARSLIGYRDIFMTDTRGTGIMNSLNKGYEPWKGEFQSRFTGSIVADRPGEAVAYALSNLEPRGILFITPREKVYEGMVVGEHSKDRDINVNPCKNKQLTNIRAAGKDDSVSLSPVTPLTLEKALHFISDDEMVEVTPQSVRIRKRELSSVKRHQTQGKKKKALVKTIQK